MKTAIITGITGQDGAYLSQLLLKKGYRVIGFVRNSKSSSLTKLSYLGITDHIIFEECNLLDLVNIVGLLKRYKPDEIYNLAAQSSVKASFDQPIATIEFNIISVINLLEAIRLVDQEIKYYQASSSEMFGKVDDLPITENTPMHPLSPYAISKAAAHWIAINYRESYGIFTCCGILFNHESILRDKNFFTKKVINDSIEISRSQRDVLRVGNIDIRRDFGYAPRYVEAMWLMLQHPTPDDYIICSGKSIQLRQILHHIFKRLGIDQNKIIIDESLYRPTEIENIYGDNSKVKDVLGWEYTTDFYEVIDILIDEQLKCKNE
jgi:GDPmannose 4,6-dehydratase